MAMRQRASSSALSCSVGFTPTEYMLPKHRREEIGGRNDRCGGSTEWRRRRRGHGRKRRYLRLAPQVPFLEAQPGAGQPKTRCCEYCGDAHESPFTVVLRYIAHRTASHLSQ